MRTSKTWIVLQESLVSALPAYQTGVSARSLLGLRGSPRLHPALAKLPAYRFDLDRPLYTHQIASLAMVQEGKNIVVATGTGSGKTECFLLPILDDALRNPGPGVRSILIYPMNALANDQLDRLRELLTEIPEITFGRYTGDTPETEREADAEALEKILPNERFTRTRIRDSPPHILLTNFAMLEYLLLRPKDDALFRDQRLRFIVLDEAHSYSGSQGIDVALLMRRLKLAFPGRPQQFVLTSATMGTGSGEPGILDFAQRLTGAAFHSGSVLTGSVVGQFDSNERGQLSLSQYSRFLGAESDLTSWFRALEDRDLLGPMIRQTHLGTNAEVAPGEPSWMLWKWLSGNHELAELHRQLQIGPCTMSGLSKYIWGESSTQADRATLWLLTLGARAKKDPTAAALLPARFHFFFRGLRGASVCLSPSCGGGTHNPRQAWHQLILEDRNTCPVCQAHVLPLLTCVHCGVPYVRAYDSSEGGWQTQRSGAPHEQVAHLFSWNRNRNDDLDEGDDSLETIESAQGSTKFLCLSCQAIGDGDCLLPCCTAPSLVELQVAPSKGDGNLLKCSYCGGKNGGFDSVLREFGTGEDGATAVLAEAIIRAMPEDDIAKPAAGRLLLAFSDSRQRAAHFAPYLSRTTAESQYRKPVVDAIKNLCGESDGGVPISAIADRFLAAIMKQPFVVLRHTLEGEPEITARIKTPKQLYRPEKEALRRECLISLLQSFTAPQRSKNTLTAFAIAGAAIELNEEQNEQFALKVPELFRAGEQQGFAAIQHLLRVILRKRAISFPPGVTLGHIQTGGGPQQFVMHYSLANSIGGRQRIRWNPFEAVGKNIVVMRSPQANIIAQAIGASLSPDSDLIVGVLRRVWDVMRDTAVLEPGEANEYILPYQQIVIRTTGSWYACDTCGVVTLDRLTDACIAPNCPGHVVELSRQRLDERYAFHHEFIRATRMEPLPLAVREHTAQLTSQHGQQYQRDFVNKMVNVLSSSTTFEMGVDVGQLKTVFLRNVPPTAANYIQRAGRAGRRMEGTAYALTYARSFPHDQIHYHAPLSIVAGSVPVPQINLANRRLGQRHVNSFLLGRFLLHLDSEIETAEDLLERTPSMVDVFCRWVSSKTHSLTIAVSDILPLESGLSAIDALGAAQKSIAELREMYQAKVMAFESQFRELKVQLQAELQTSGTVNRRSATLQDHLLKLLSQLRRTRLIDYLAAEHWLPGYAFPQDVVRLLVRESKLADRVRLERDAEYGIAEYAPGSEVIADGYLIRSRGIDKQGQELHLEGYRACTRCNNVELSSDRKALSRACRTCGTAPTRAADRARDYVIPPGFTTDIEESAEEVRFSRVRPPSPSKIFLISGAQELAFLPHPDLPGVVIGYRQDGELFRACAAKGGAPFRICLTCGRAGDSGKKTKHKTPWGTDCRNERLSHVDLGYRFQTDTLQIRFAKVNPRPPRIDDLAFWLSFQTAFVGAAAQELSIPSRDLDGTYRSQESTEGEVELVLFDRIPGGAGYVQRIGENLGAILFATLRRVRVCVNPRCDPNGSCYCCLRSYHNQFQWDNLRRNVVTEWLEAFLSTLGPETILSGPQVQ